MNNSITITSIEECQECIIDDNENLEPQSECCIYRVPEILRKVNEDAYTPKVISIGPLHHGIKKFADMEKQKIRYKREFGKRITIEKWQELINFIEENEQRIRNCYAEKSVLKKLKFITMILYDAVFIIEFILGLVYRRINDFLVGISVTRFTIRTDLELLENQLPFFVLHGLYQLAFPSSPVSFIWLSSVAFEHCDRDWIPDVAVEEVKHFTDLRRYFMTRTCPISKSPKFLSDLPCAEKLQKSGVKFTASIDPECLLDISFGKKKLWFPFSEVDELQIPNIQLNDSSEYLIRNVIVWEQCFYNGKTLVCNYIDLMDMLIDTEEDVNLLVEAGIITNNMRESVRIARMFNKLGRHISLSPSHYDDVFDGLKAHYDNRWNHAKATLKRVYFNDLWRGTATVAAVVLLLLTLIQTICSIKSVV